MRSPTIMKEVSTTDVALGHPNQDFFPLHEKNIFISSQTLKKNLKFEWKKVWEEAFLKLKNFLAIPPILICLEDDA